jgi:hypothetical protein
MCDFPSIMALNLSNNTFYQVPGAKAEEEEEGREKGRGAKHKDLLRLVLKTRRRCGEKSLFFSKN